MGDKTLWGNYDKNGDFYSIYVPADRPVFQVHRIQGGINFEANSIAMQTLSPKAYMLYMILVSRPPYRIWALTQSSIKWCNFPHLPSHPRHSVERRRSRREDHPGNSWTEGLQNHNGSVCPPCRKTQARSSQQDRRYALCIRMTSGL